MPLQVDFTSCATNLATREVLRRREEKGSQPLPQVYAHPETRSPSAALQAFWFFCFCFALCFLPLIPVQSSPSIRCFYLATTTTHTNPFPLLPTPSFPSETSLCCLTFACRDMMLLSFLCFFFNAVSH